MKCNSDAAFDSATGKDFVRIVCRNARGKMEAAASLRIFGSSPLIAEALGLRTAMEFISNLGISNIVFESDNQILIEACRSGKINKEIRGIIEDVKSLRNRFERCAFTWTAREGNLVAHTIASLASSGSLTGNWSLNPPPMLQSALFKDAASL